MPERPWRRRSTGPSFDREDRAAETKRTVAARARKKEPKSLVHERGERDFPRARSILGARDTPGRDAREARETKRRKERDAVRRLRERGLLTSGFGFPGRDLRDVVLGDVKQIGFGLSDLAADYATAISRDVRQPGIPFERTGRLIGRDVVGLGEAVDLVTPRPDFLQPVAEFLPDFLAEGEQSAAEDRAEAARAFREDPLISALTLLGVVAPAFRAGSVGTLQGSIRAANPGFTRREAFRAGRLESRLPGRAAAQGIAGGIEPRILRGKFGEATGRPLSRDPIGRAGQRVFDRGSELIEATRGPGARFATSRRAAGASARQREKRRQRTAAEIARLERDVAKGIGRFGRNKPLQSAVVAALEGPRGVTPRQAVELRLRDLRETPTLAIEPQRGAIRSRLDNKAKELERALADERLDSPEFEDAVQAAEAISVRAEESFRRTFPGFTDEDLAARRNLIVERYAKQGILPEGVEAEARGFFPHRDAFESISGGIGPPTLAASGSVIGRARPGRAFERRRNELRLFEEGRVQTNPRVLSNTARQRARFEQTQDARGELYAIGRDIVEGDLLPERRMIAIRNPTTDATYIPPHIRAAIENPDEFANIVARTGDTPARGAVDDFVDTWLYDPKSRRAAPQWLADQANVRVVPEAIAKVLLADAFASSPRGTFLPLIGTLNSVARFTTIYSPFGGARYVARNTPQNMILLAMTQPKAFLRTRGVVGNMRRKHNAVYEAVKVETGKPAAAAGLPELPGSRRSAAQRVEGSATDVSRAVADRLGNITDEPWRVSSWVEYARQYGFKGPAGWKSLLDSDDPNVVRVRDDIAQRVRDDMLDFDALPRALRESLSRYFFILPFKFAAAKWPLVYLREYPLRAAILSLVATQHEREGTEGRATSVLESGRTEIGGREVDIGLLLPHLPSAEIAEDAIALAGEFRKLLTDEPVSLRPLTQQLGPQYRLAIDAGGGRGVSREQVASGFLPGFSTATKLGQGGGAEEQLLRALGLTVDFIEPAPRRRTGGSGTTERRRSSDSIARPWRTR